MGQIWGGIWGRYGGIWGQVPAPAPVHGADTDPASGKAELCGVFLSKYLDFPLFASKQSETCFSTEAGGQLATTQICTGRCTAAESRL